VSRKEPKVLAAGLEREAFERLAPELRLGAVGVDWVATAEAGVALAAESRYDVILMDAEPRDWPLPRVVRELRAPGSPSRDAGILILAEPDQVDAARALKSRGVNRVMLVSDPPEMIRQQMATLLDVAPRAGVRLPTNLESAIGSTGRELFCQTENLSLSGMLVKTRHRPQLGSKVAFKIDLSDPMGTIFGRGELVRYSTREQGGVDGIGIKFLSFADDGEQKLQHYLEHLGRELEHPPAPPRVTGPASTHNPRPATRGGSEPEIVIEFE